ncbi:hypothetical protein [Chitinophaga eiseniae]|uniref:Uncharacterized protein n=1 Tax=Chitinophaga eiseniae TaxID=634771 RepID=A0A847SMR5_9BACT|nr:hypothetical protein [Chitinophaga eiseniae]NLR78469.1 hypothetical protein [Chitinophaga eiseniae]
MKQNTNGPQLIDTTFYSIGFPFEDQELLVTRTHYLSLIEGYLEKSTNVVFLEGDTGAGKTTILGQYAKQKFKECISVFFNPLNSLDYNMEFFCENIVLQLRHLLGENVDANSNEHINQDTYRTTTFQVRKKYKNSNKKITLIIDGLENKGSDDIIKEILDQLPYGNEIFNFVITSDSSFKSNYFKNRNVNAKTITVTGFSEREMEDFLGFAIEDKRSIFKVTKGFPGRLKTLKRILATGEYSLNDISENSQYNDWINLDCQNVDLNNSRITAVLSLVALSDIAFSVNDIAQILLMDEIETKHLIELSSVLEVGNKVQFISFDYRKYFVNNLRTYKKRVEELLINHYKAIHSPLAMVELPRLYSEKQEWKNVIDVFDDEYSNRIIDSTESIIEVNRSLLFGLKAAQNLSSTPDMYRFALESSMIHELDNFLFWESEVNARIAIKDFSGAISLAECAILKIDRFQLLSLIARKQKEIQKYVDEDLVSLIQEIYLNTDFSTAGSKIYDIVANLIYGIPNLAIEIIEKSSGSTVDTGINDWIVAKLSVAAIDSSIKEKEDPEKSKTMQALEKMGNEDSQKISKAISMLVGNYSGGKVLDDAKRISDSTERLRLLRLWLVNNRSNDSNLGQVIRVALDELVASTSEGTYTLDNLKELSDRLPFVKDKKILDELYYRFKQIEKSTLKAGLTRNKIIYRLNLFHTEYNLNDVLAFDSLKSIITEAEKIDDTLIQLESYAEIYCKLNWINSNQYRQQYNFAYSRILRLSEILFNSTANHSALIKVTIKTIGKQNPVLALKIVTLINLQWKRESARHNILDAYLKNGIKRINIDLLIEIQKSFEFPKSHERFCIAILDRYSEASSLPSEVIKRVLPIFNIASKIKSPSGRTYAFVKAYQVIGLNDYWKNKLADRYENLIKASLKKIETEWERIDVGFSVCADTSQTNIDFAKVIFDETSIVKNDNWIDSNHVAKTYILSLKLVILAMSGLMATDDLKENEVKIFGELIDRIPSESERIKLWTELAFYAYSYDNYLSLAKRICDNNISPILDSLIRKDLDVSQLLDSFTLVYVFMQTLAIEKIEKLPEELKERVYDNICSFYVTAENPFVEYDSHNNNYNPNFTDLSNAIELLKRMSTDFLIYGQVTAITKGVAENRKLSRPQIAEFVSNLTKIISTKLPDKRNIKHKGYSLLAQVKVDRINKDLPNVAAHWTAVISTANQISNLSDRIFVKSILLEDLPWDRLPNQLQTEVYQGIVDEIENLTSYFEYVQRVADVSEAMFSVNKTKWKDIIKKAFHVCNQIEGGSSAYKSQQKILDTIYRLDSAYAKELVKIASEGESPYRFNKLLQRRMEYHDTVKKINEGRTLEERDKENKRNTVDAIAGSLRLISSGKIPSKKFLDASSFLFLGNSLPLHEVYPVYQYYLFNCAQTYKTKQTKGPIANLHKENFKKAVNSTNLIRILSYRKKGVESTFRQFFIDEEFATNLAVKPGSREEALSFIRTWLSDQMQDFLIIADPYFEKEDLDLLKIVNDVNKDVSVSILGSLNGYDSMVEQNFKEYWKKISSIEPPFTHVYFCWIPEDGNGTPFHDRWIITKDSGLRLGTSVNSVGRKKESEISIMTTNDAFRIKEQQLSEYLQMRKRHVNGFRVTYKTFSL